VLLDLSAAFDTVDHHILLLRLKRSCGITGLVRQWFESYMVGRRQFVRTGSSTSSPALILCGVPQGSVLRPFLFLLYTADLLLLIESHGRCAHLYGDDTQVYGLCRPSATLELQNSIEICGQVDALQSAPAQYCKDRGSLVYIQPTPPSATRVTNPSGFCCPQRHLHGR